jgi:hypothetical protein
MQKNVLSGQSVRRVFRQTPRSRADGDRRTTPQHGFGRSPDVPSGSVAAGTYVQFADPHLP